MRHPNITVILTAWLAFAFWGPSPAPADTEETYSISLTKTAETEKGRQIHEVEDKKVLAQEYTVQDGDHLWQLLRERGLLEKRNLGEILATLKKLNKSLRNLNLIHPGEKIIIPLKIAPRSSQPAKEQAVETVKIAELKDIDFQNYTVRKDDQLIKIIRGMYQIPPKKMYDDYLKLVRQINPSIQNIDKIYPGQTVRLPIYSPEVVRVPIKKSVEPEKSEDREKPEPVYTPNPLTHDLAAVVTEIGEEWIDTGEHFIPLKTGGQINLKASSFPIINQKNGHRVIVDLDHKLPPKMGRLIESSWENYGVVTLQAEDDLRTAVGKIIKECRFPQVSGSGSPMTMGKFISLKIVGDWIIHLPKTTEDDAVNAVVINIKDKSQPDIPGTIKDYLAGLGVKLIDYPSQNDATAAWTDTVETLSAGTNSASLVQCVLDLTGRPYVKDAALPAFQTQKADVRMVIQADFQLNQKGKTAVIDLTGLEKEVISLLREQGYATLSLAEEKNGTKMISKICEFLGIPVNQGPHLFKAIPGPDTRNVILTLSGTVFKDADGESILATRVALPQAVKAFLYQKGYRVMTLTF